MLIRNLNKEGLRELKTIRMGTEIPLTEISNGLSDLNFTMKLDAKSDEKDVKSKSLLSRVVNEVRIPGF